MISNPIIILTGKTASGKDTVMSKLMIRFPGLKRIITTTSRSPRMNEKQGIDYNFISEADFKQKIQNGDFIEYVNYAGNLYGTEKAEIAASLNQDLIWRIDPSRAGQIRQLIKNSFDQNLAKALLKRILVIYLTVDDEVVLKRLAGRGLNQEEIAKRMQEDKNFWEEFKNNYDFVVENVAGQLGQTVDKIVGHFSSQKGIASIIIILGIAVILGVALFKNNNPPPLAPTTSTILVPTLSPTPTIIPSSLPISTVAVAPTPLVTPQPVTNNIPPGSGYSRQIVSVEGQNYPVSIVAGDLNSTKVIVDTASESDCSNDCPALALADYVGRNGAYAGINGSFFCPPEYPSCSGKTNSFDTLLMNKNKRYFNSDNNVYSTVPAAIFSAGFARFVSRTLEWGRDQGVDSVIANYPLLVAASNINFTENPAEPKFGQKGARTFIATKGNKVYIGVISNATMGESAKVLHTLGMDEALNLDEGGSTALWYEGYKAGPGRNIPNAVLFVRR